MIILFYFNMIFMIITVIYLERKLLLQNHHQTIKSLQNRYQQQSLSDLSLIGFIVNTFFSEFIVKVRHILRTKQRRDYGSFLLGNNLNLIRYLPF